MKSASKDDCSRTVLYRLVPRSRTIKRTNSAEHAAEPFGQLLVKVPMGVAAENSLPASVAFCPLAPDASPVRQALVLGFSFTAFHTTIVRDELSLCKCRPGRFLSRRNQARLARKHVALKCSIAQFWCSPVSFPSDCLPDVLPQVFESAQFAGECPHSVRVFEAIQHAG